jgi:hypothetical protein
MKTSVFHTIKFFFSNTACKPSVPQSGHGHHSQCVLKSHSGGYCRIIWEKTSPLFRNRLAVISLFASSRSSIEPGLRIPKDVSAAPLPVHSSASFLYRPGQRYIAELLHQPRHRREIGTIGELCVECCLTRTRRSEAGNTNAKERSFSLSSAIAGAVVRGPERLSEAKQSMT